MKRRAFITLLSGAAAMPFLCSTNARSQAGLPVIAFVNGAAPDASARYAAAFRKGLSESGNVEGRNVTVEYHWLEGQYDRVPALMADLVRRRVNVIVTPGFPPGALAAKAATDTIPIVFGVGDDPVKLGLVASLARPGGNATGINFFVWEITSKRLALLHELVPKAVRIAVMVNPGNASSTEATLREAQEAARTLGLQIQVFNAGTDAEIDTAFAALVRESTDALFIAGDGFLNNRRDQFIALAARYRLPASSASREYVEAGGLMSYGASVADMFRQAGIYAGSIVKGAKPGDLPVVQPTRLEFVINLQTARALGLEVSPMLLTRADAVIE